MSRLRFLYATKTQKQGMHFVRIVQKNDRFVQALSENSAYLCSTNLKHTANIGDR
jgi:hypothetical protein